MLGLIKKSAYLLHYLKGNEYYKDRIRELEKELASQKAAFDGLTKSYHTELQKNALLDASPLPKCKNLACIRCEHVIYQDVSGRTFIYGCGKGKDNQCEDYKPAENADHLDRLYSSFYEQQCSGDKLTE